VNLRDLARTIRLRKRHLLVGADLGMSPWRSEASLTRSARRNAQRSSKLAPECEKKCVTQTRVSSGTQAQPSNSARVGSSVHGGSVLPRM